MQLLGAQAQYASCWEHRLSMHWGTGSGQCQLLGAQAQYAAMAGPDLQLPVMHDSEPRAAPSSAASIIHLG